MRNSPTPFPISKSPAPTGLRIAIIADWLTTMGGSERVILALHSAFPTADIYTSVYEPDELLQKNFANVTINTSWLQKLPRPVRKLHKLFPMLRVRAFRDLDLSEYDIIISSTSAEAKQVRKTRPEQIHICYCYTPIRYYWSHYDEYRKNPGLGKLNWLARLMMPIMVPPLRRADYSASQEVDQFIAISTTVQKRIKKYYGRDSIIIHPPVDFQRFLPTAKKLADRSGYVSLGRQVPYKRIDLAVRACTALGLPLTVIGNGSEHEKLRAMAGPTVEFVVGADDSAVSAYLGSSKGFIFPTEEDFGIVQVEALASGTPVIAYARGGSEDIVENGKGGITFDEQTVESLSTALLEMEKTQFQPADLQKIAKRFHINQFIAKMRKVVEDSR